MDNMKVEQYNAMNQFHLYGNGINELQSYNSLVVKIKWVNGKAQIVLGRDWDYSTTTSKYVYMFLDEYGDINFYGVSNKRQYVNKLINEGKIAYDENMC